MIPSLLNPLSITNDLSHQQDTIHAEKWCTEMCNFRMAALMFLTGHGIKTYAHSEIAHFPTQFIIRTWKALALWPRASQTMMHLIGKCAISTWTWVLAIFLVLPNALVT